jgi:hypothetical protein
LGRYKIQRRRSGCEKSTLQTREWVVGGRLQPAEGGGERTNADGRERQGGNCGCDYSMAPVLVGEELEHWCRAQPLSSGTQRGCATEVRVLQLLREVLTPTGLNPDSDSSRHFTQQRHPPDQGLPGGSCRPCKQDCNTDTIITTNLNNHDHCTVRNSSVYPLSAARYR